FSIEFEFETEPRVPPGCLNPDRSPRQVPEAPCGNYPPEGGGADGEAHPGCGRRGQHPAAGGDPPAARGLPDHDGLRRERRACRGPQQRIDSGHRGTQIVQMSTENKGLLAALAAFSCALGGMALAAASARLTVDRKGALRIPKATLKALQVKPASNGMVCLEF